MNTEWPTQEQEAQDRVLYEKCVREQQVEIRRLKELYFARKYGAGNDQYSH